MVSRSHTTIQRSSDRSYIVIDLGSRNGTYVNGRRVSVPAELSNADRITVGQHEFVFEHEIPDEQQQIADSGTEQEGAEEQTRLFYSLRRTTVLVIDIRDFTGLSQRLDEDVLARTIGTWINKRGAILKDHDSWGQKYISDAIMTVWIRSGNSHSASKALLGIAALREIVNVTQAPQSQFKLPEPIRIGAGMNTGEASIGNSGSDAASDYTALGDCVNLAFRLESATRQLNVDFLLGEETYKDLASTSVDLNLFEKRTATLKGHSTPSTCYSLSFEKLAQLAVGIESDSSNLTTSHMP